MRKPKFSESLVIGIMAEGEAGLPVGEVCRKHGISSATYYHWKSKYAGMSHLRLHRPLEPSVLGTGSSPLHASVGQKSCLTGPSVAVALAAARREK